MNRLSLSFKLISLVSVICLLLSGLSGFVLHQGKKSSQAYNSIATNSHPKVKELGDLLAIFRQIRIEVRSFGLQGNTGKDFKKYSDNAVLQVELFEQNFNQLRALLTSREERLAFSKMEAAWAQFKSFGQEMLSLAEKGDNDSLDRMRRDIRILCPVKAKNFTSILKDLLAEEESQAEELVRTTKENARQTFYTATAAIIFISILAIFVGVLFARRISLSLQRSTRELLKSSAAIDQRSFGINRDSFSLSEAVQKQSSSLQQTAASVDEIAQASSEQAEGIKEINSAVYSLDEVTKENAGIAVNSERSAKNLKEEVGSLNRVVEQLKNLVEGGVENMSRKKVTNEAPEEVSAPVIELIEDKEAS